MKTIGIKVTLDDYTDFGKIAETLTRIGILRDDVLTQTCNILHKKGEYFIVHFKEMFDLDGVSKSEMTTEEIARRNYIVKLLVEWNLCTPVDSIELNNGKGVKVVSHRDKHKYTLKSNYTIGKKIGYNPL